MPLVSHHIKALDRVRGNISASISAYCENETVTYQIERNIVAASRHGRTLQHVHISINFKAFI
jgi:hypothetical protein